MYYTIDYHDTLRSIDRKRKQEITSRVEKLAGIKTHYGKPLCRFTDKKTPQRCFELKSGELRVIYFYQGDIIHVVGIGERSKKKVYAVAKEKLRYL